MEKLTVEEIRTLQLALDNMASDGMLDSGIQKLMALHNKLDRIADAEHSVQADECPHCHAKPAYTDQHTYPDICSECGTRR